MTHICTIKYSLLDFFFSFYNKIRLSFQCYWLQFYNSPASDLTLVCCSSSSVNVIIGRHCFVRGQQWSSSVVFILVLLLHFAETANCGSILFFQVWNFVFATVMCTQGYVYFLLQQLPGFPLTILKQYLLTEGFRIVEMLHCVLPRKLHGRYLGSGNFVGFSQWVTDHRYKLSISPGWVAGPVYSSGWSCFLSHFYVAIWVYLQLWTSAFDTILHLSTSVLSASSALSDSTWKIFPLTWMLTFSLLSKHEVELEGPSGSWVILRLLPLCWMSLEEIIRRRQIRPGTTSHTVCDCSFLFFT